MCFYVYGMYARVFPYVYIYMGVHAWIGVCLWKPEVDIRNLPRLLYSFEEESVRSVIKPRASW